MLLALLMQLPKEESPEAGFPVLMPCVHLSVCDGAFRIKTILFLDSSKSSEKYVCSIQLCSFVCLFLVFVVLLGL